ncbi:hypothetical protein Tco_1446048 [Tanacetum coccineum]
MAIVLADRLGVSFCWGFLDLIHGSKKDFLYRTPHIMAYCLALILMALTFFAFTGSFATRRESTFAVKFCTPICSAIRKPAIKASYSASLFDASNSTLNAHEDPSVKMVHGSGTSSSAVVSVDVSSSSSRSVMKTVLIASLVAQSPLAIALFHAVLQGFKEG